MNLVIKLKKIIPNKFNKELLIMLFILFIGILLEIFSLSSLFPLISILFDDNFLVTNIYVNEIKNTFNLTNSSFIVCVGIGIFLLFLTKSLFLFFLSVKQNRIMYNLSASIYNYIFESYLNRDYYYHKSSNSSDILKVLQTEIPMFGALCFNLVTLIIETALLCSIIFFLFYLNFIATISLILFFGFFASLFFIITTKKLKIWGVIREQVDSSLIKLTMEGLGGIKLWKLLMKEDFFTRKIESANLKKARVYANNNIVAQLPRYYFELIFVIGIIFFILILFKSDKDFSYFLSTFSVFVASMVRVIPSINKVVSSIQNIQFNLPVVDELYNHTQTFSSDRVREIQIKKSISFNNKITIKNLSYSYDKSTIIFENLNMEIEKGSMIGIVGGSGVGKSTFTDVLVGLLRQSSGEILVDNEDISNCLSSWKRMIGYVPQNVYLTDDTIINNISFGEKCIDLDMIQTVIKDSMLSDHIDNLKEGLNTKVGERGSNLSGGQIQRIGIARSLYHNPSLLIFDEATSALDSKTEEEILKTLCVLRENGMTIIVISHNDSTLKYCDKKYKLTNKKFKDYN